MGKRLHRNNSQSAIKSLVEYTSEVSSEDFSGPEDGEVDSDGGRNSPQNHQKARRPALPPRTPPLVANASPINDDEDIDLGGEIEQTTAISPVTPKPATPQTPPEREQPL